MLSDDHPRAHTPTDHDVSTPAVSHLDPMVAVIVDGHRSEFMLTRYTVLRALEHWGMPYHVVDLAKTRNLAKEIGRSGVVLIAQEYLGEPLSAEIGALVRHVQAGGALVNLDHTLFAYPEAYRELVRMCGEAEEISLQRVIITDVPHPVLQGRPSGYSQILKHPVSAIKAAGVPDDGLLAAGTGEPLLRTELVGDGRLVQWLVSPKLWNERYLGFAHGLDGLLWRSIVWAAPKPFCMNSMPPFARFRFDDCNGHWRDPADLAFVDEFTSRGHVPSICFCLHSLSGEGAQHVASLQRSGKIDLAPHTYAPSRSLYFGDEQGEYSTERFREIFADVDQAKERWGVNWSTILSDHDHEWSPAVVPFLRQRGIRHKMNILLPGERWADVHRDWRPRPYGSMSYALDHLPGELSDFFVVFNHHPSFDSARAYLEPGTNQFIYHRTGGFGDQKWDFLNGLVHSEEDRGKDLNAIAARIAEHSRIGLDSLFFGGSITHSHFTRHLSMKEWSLVLDRVGKQLKGLEQVPASYDQIADYAEARAGTHVVSARMDGHYVRVDISGRSHRALQMSSYVESDGELLREERPIAPFDGVTSLLVPTMAEL